MGRGEGGLEGEWQGGERGVARVVKEVDFSLGVNMGSDSSLPHPRSFR